MRAGVSRGELLESPIEKRSPEFSVQMKTESSIVAARFWARRLAPTEARVTGFLMSLILQGSPREARKTGQTEPSRRPEDRKSHDLTVAKARRSYPV